MSYPLDRRVHQPTLAADLSDALGRTVRVAQRPPASEDGTPGLLVVIDAVTGDELDDLDETTVAGVVDGHVPPERPDPDAEFRQAIEAATSVADLKAALLGTHGPGAQPRRDRGE